MCLVSFLVAATFLYLFLFVNYFFMLYNMFLKTLKNKIFRKEKINSVFFVFS